MIDQILTFFSMLMAVGFVIFLAYFTTIIIGKKSNRFVKNSTIKVLEKSSIGLQVSITIIEINSKVYILANQGKQLILLDTLDSVEWHQKRSKVLEEIKPQQQPIPIELLLNKIKSVGIKSTLKKGDEDHTDED